MVSTEAFKNDISTLPGTVPLRPGGASVREDFQQPKKSEEERSASSRASWVVEYDQLRASVRVRNYSVRTFEAYVHWVGAFQAFVRSNPPGELSGEDVKAFLTHLAVEKDVAASTQNQAFNALLFFYRHVLGREFGEVKGVVRAKRRP